MIRKWALKKLFCVLQLPIVAFFVMSDVATRGHFCFNFHWVSVKSSGFLFVSRQKISPLGLDDFFRNMLTNRISECSAV